MSYRYAMENINYEDFSSGRVLYNQQGATSFPVRYSCEIFMRCKNILEKSGNYGPYLIYDPLCGGAYTLTTLGLLYGESIKGIYATDMSEEMVLLAKKNLSLLTEEGLAERRSQLEAYLQEYGKESHKEAIVSTMHFEQLLKKQKPMIRTMTGVSDALNQEAGLLEEKIDMVITDLPYGEVVDWIKQDSMTNEIACLLEQLLPKLNPNGIVAVTAPKKVKIQGEAFERVEQFQIGKRQTVILRAK